MSPGTIEWLSRIAELLFDGSALAVTLFVMLYGFRSAWWVNPIGRVVFGFMLTVAIIMDLVLFFDYVWTPSLEVLAILSVVLYGLLFGGLVNLNYLLIMTQRKEHHERKTDRH